LPGEGGNPFQKRRMRKGKAIVSFLFCRGQGNERVAFVQEKGWEFILGRGENQNNQRIHGKDQVGNRKFLFPFHKNKKGGKSPSIGKGREPHGEKKSFSY